MLNNRQLKTEIHFVEPYAMFCNCRFRFRFSTNGQLQNYNLQKSKRERKKVRKKERKKEKKKERKNVG